MLTHRSRDWSVIKETMRRERIVQDLVRRSAATRLHQRVTIADADRAWWKRAERLIGETERRIQDLDPSSPLFWGRYCELNGGLLDLYRDANVSFDL